MSTRKTIQINPALFNVGKHKTTEKSRPPKEKPVIRPNALKRELMKRIKSHADKKTKDETSVSEFSNDFDKHLEYLNGLSKQSATRTRKNRQTAVSPSSPSPIKQIIMPPAFLELPPELNDTNYFPTQNTMPREEPPYGCLKKGDKPTYKDWKRTTQKNRPEINSSVQVHTNMMPSENVITYNPLPVPVPVPVPVPIIESTHQPLIQEHVSIQSQPSSQLKINPLLGMKSEREKKLDDIKERFKQKDMNEEINTNIKKAQMANEPRRFQYNKTVKRTYGKHNGRVSVCIKDSSTRKNIIQEQIELRKTPIANIKEYLRSKYLLRAGSNAPNDVLRKMYEDAHLAGDIMNKNEDNLLHNYISGSIDA